MAKVYDSPTTNIYALLANAQARDEEAAPKNRSANDKKAPVTELTPKERAQAKAIVDAEKKAKKEAEQKKKEAEEARKAALALIDQTGFAPQRHQRIKETRTERNAEPVKTEGKGKGKGGKSWDGEGKKGDWNKSDNQAQADDNAWESAATTTQEATDNAWGVPAKTAGTGKSNFNKGDKTFNKTFNKGEKTFNKGERTFNKGEKTFDKEKTFNKGEKTFNKGERTFNKGEKTFDKEKTFNKGEKTFDKEKTFNKGEKTFNKGEKTFDGKKPKRDGFDKHSQGTTGRQFNPAKGGAGKANWDTTVPSGVNEVSTTEAFANATVDTDGWGDVPVSGAPVVNADPAWDAVPAEPLPVVLSEWELEKKKEEEEEAKKRTLEDFFVDQEAKKKALEAVVAAPKVRELSEDEKKAMTKFTLVPKESTQAKKPADSSAAPKTTPAPSGARKGEKPLAVDSLFQVRIAGPPPGRRTYENKTNNVQRPKKTRTQKIPGPQGFPELGA